MTRRNLWSFLTITTVCLAAVQAPGETKPPVKKASAKKTQKKQAAPRRPKRPPWAKLATEKRGLDKRIQAVDRQLAKDAELNANRKVLRDVITKKAKAKYKDYAKRQAELAALRKKIRDVQATIAKMEAEVARDPAVAKLQREVNKLVVAKGNKIDGNYGKWIARRDEVQRKISKMQQEAKRKAPASPPRKAPRKKASPKTPTKRK